MSSLLAFAVDARDKSVPPHSVPRLAGVLREIKHLVRLIYSEVGMKTVGPAPAIKTH